MTTRPWIVTPHGPLEVLEDNLWSVAGEVPSFPRGCGMNRRMSIVRLADGRLVFHNAIPLDDSTLARVVAWGRPSVLIVPMHLHAMDAPAFRERLGLAVYTSALDLERVRALLPVEGSLEALPLDESVHREPLAGTKLGEAAYVVRSGPRASLLFCDAVHASLPGTGINGFIFRRMGFTGPDLRSPPAYRMRAVSDRPALKRDLLRLADTPGLARIVPSHGRVMTEEPAAALRAAAEKYL